MLVIIQLNVNGIRGKFKSLHSLARDCNASVVVVCELKTSNFYAYDRAELDKLLGYKLYLESARCAVYVADTLKKTSKKSTPSASTSKRKSPSTARNTSTAAPYRLPTIAHIKSS